MRFQEKLAQFMYGRRGIDEFSRFLLIAELVMIALSSIMGGIVQAVIRPLILACLVYAGIRIFSRNMSKRQKENAWYLRKKTGFLKWFRSVQERWVQRKEFRFFRCPSCHTLLRVPKGKGKILLTCRKCGNRFERRS